MVERDDGVYSMGAVVKMLGLTATTLRAWEDRYAVVVPGRSPGGQRLYSRDDVDRLRFVCDQVEGGLSPADAHRLLSERGRRSAAEPEDRSVLSILIAERDLYAADLAEYFLLTEGYDATVVLDADQAAVEIIARPPSLVVIDLLISGGVGLELCRTVRAGVDSPILAISAIDARDDALAAGADAFLCKPLEPLQFVSTVRDLLGTSAIVERRGSVK